MDWFPFTPSRQLSVAHPGNQARREGGSGQLGTNGGNCQKMNYLSHKKTNVRAWTMTT